MPSLAHVRYDRLFQNSHKPVRTAMFVRESRLKRYNKRVSRTSPTPIVAPKARYVKSFACATGKIAPS